MELVRYNPFSTAPTMSRLFDDFFETPGFCREAKLWSPEVDIFEEDGKIIIQADLPGVEKEDLSITAENGVLTLNGERKSQTEKKEKHLFRRERFCGQFQRAFRLPERTDVEKIEASFKNGVLHIAIAKKEEPKGKKITIH